MAADAAATGDVGSRRLDLLKGMRVAEDFRCLPPFPQDSRQPFGRTVTAARSIRDARCELVKFAV